MSALIWVHEDALRSHHPVFAAAGDEARAIFVWDENYFQKQGYTRKRLIFIVECLADLPVEVFKGDMKAVLSALAQETPIFTAATSNPEFRRIIEALSITPIDEIPLARIETQTDLGRFFRYWKKARKSVMSHNGVAEGQKDLFS